MGHEKILPDVTGRRSRREAGRAADEQAAQAKQARTELETRNKRASDRLQRDVFGQLQRKRLGSGFGFSLGGNEDKLG